MVHFFRVEPNSKKWLYAPWPQSPWSQGDWLRATWEGETILPDVAKQMVFQLHDARRLMLSQDWSLGIELRASLLIPVFLFLARWNWPLLVGASIGFAYFAHSTGFYYTSFIVGVLTARYNSETDQFRYGGILFAIGLLFYQARWLGKVAEILPSFVKEREIWLLTTIGCMFILLGSLRSRNIRKLLEHRFLLYLGRISFSLYLLQMIVLICLAPWLVAGLSRIGVQSVGLMQFLLLVSVSLVSLPLADLAERFIEVPCIHFGISITAWLKRYAVIHKLSF